MGGKIDNSVSTRGGPVSFRISGENYHRIGSLLPPPGGRARFIQLYIHDTEHELENCIYSLYGSDNNADRVATHVVEGLKIMLDEINPYVKRFRNARDMLRENEAVDIRLKIINARQNRQCTEPTSNEVAALIVGEDMGHVTNRDIILNSVDGTLKRIYETHPSYKPLQYPLLFPHGTDGWRSDIQICMTAQRYSQNVSMREFYAYRLMMRATEGLTLLRGGRLFQQFVVDCWTAIEHSKLNYIKTHQSDLRADLYQGLEDAFVAGDVDARVVGRRFVLPSSFTGGPRNMIQHYQDAMAICRHFGHPDLFITFTCNPNWKEIQDELKRIPGQKAEDRPDITARVFRIKQKYMLECLKTHKFFGKVLADVSVIEFKKRGLPHTHIILTLDPEDKPNTAEKIDQLISAELPDKNEDPVAFEIVMNCMIHGPCGDGFPNAPCMVNGKCSKHYPKRFCNTTTIENDGFVSYRRRNDPTKQHLKNGVMVDSRWVVPYFRDLLVLFDAHINVEIVGVNSVFKYLYKYINKGSDRANVLLQDMSITTNENGQHPIRSRDEIKQYLDCRYVSSIEACWKIFKLDMQRQNPSVEKLQYHLPDHQFVIFNDDDHLHEVLDRDSVRHTMLTKWFEANVNHTTTRTLTYAEFPTEWVWKKGVKEWTPRQGTKRCIGRLSFAHPHSGERYFLRMLLHKVRGAQSFENLRTIDGVLHPTFKAACIALGLLSDDNEWNEALTEASTWASAKNLRNMFCTMLMFSEVSNPLSLWERHWKSLTDDLSYRIRTDMGNARLPIHENDLKNLGFFEIEIILNRNGRSLRDFPPMPLPSYQEAEFSMNRLIREELDYDCAAENLLYEELRLGLNDEQKNIFNEIVHNYTNNLGGMFFVNGGGGTGKTYLWRTLIAKFRSERKIVISVASSGIEALLLPGGRTSQSRFKIPINLDETSTCNINCNSDLAKLIQETSLIIWDEAPMTHRHAFEAVDKSFEDILKNPNASNQTLPFGGKLVVLGGDFRQILPIVPDGGKEATLLSTIKNSYLWDHVRVLNLRQNMRVMGTHLSEATRQDLKKFSDWVLSVGEGKVQATSFSEVDETNWISIPDQFLIKNETNAKDRLINAVYSDLNASYMNASYMGKRAILAPKNSDVDALNSKILSMLPGDERIYMSSDSVCTTENAGVDHLLHPPEILNSLSIPGLPPHCLALKVGAPVILLRNINQSLGLCNGTRLTIEMMGDKVIQAKIMTGINVADLVLIPRISLTPQTLQTPFSIKRRQFPLKLAFAMTINKSQGQTLKNVGVYLPDPVFTHGQLYVALSRVTSPCGLKLLLQNQEELPWNYTKNIVYSEIF